MTPLRWLVLVLLFAAILRLSFLGENPPGLYWDEVSLGYNAYSILKTGHDEHNEFLPLTHFKAFGDYKPPGYIYATIPSVGIFGLNNFAVRLPSAVSGIVAVALTYFLVLELFSLHPFKKQLALLATTMLAISPWHIQLSRVAFEANLAATLNLAGVYLFLRSRKNSWLLVLSAMAFVATMYTFNANRLLAPLLGLFLGIAFFRHLWRHKKQTAVALIVSFLLVAPLIPHLRSPEGKLRWQEVNIFSDLDVIITSNNRIERDGGGLLARLMSHRYFAYTQEFLKHYFDHFGGRYLFLTGDGNPRLSLQTVGELYLIELPLLLIGFYAIIKDKQKMAALILIGWFVLAPVPSATARETPHALRSVSELPTPQIIIALGLMYVFSQLKGQATRKMFIIVSRLPAVLVGFLFLVSLTYFQIDYYRYYPKEYAGEWLTAYPKLVTYLKNSPQTQTAQTITVIPDLNRPYIYFLFYTQYPPADFAREVDRTGDALGFFEVHGFAKYRFERPNPDQIKRGDIFVVLAKETYPGFATLTEITDSTGKPVFTVLQKS